MKRPTTHRLLQIILFLVVFALAAAAPVHAWDSFGHMEVAYLAYQKLTPTTKARVWTLLQRNPDFATWETTIPAGTSDTDKQLMIFMIASIWADEIKGVAPYKDRFTDEDPQNVNVPDGATSAQNIGYTDPFRHRYWHFIDRPFSRDGTLLPAVPQPNALTQIIAFRAVLSSTSADDLKSYDLVWLLHLVGDVHQPLHCTTRVESGAPNGDQGGNAVKCPNCIPGFGELHGFWDDVLGTTGDNPDYQSVITAAKKLPKPVASKAKITNADVWITEGVAFAKSTVYKAPILAGHGPFTLTDKYKAAAKALAMQRVAVAGARLGNLLNQELK
jgi:S1/P1 Nuclease